MGVECTAVLHRRVEKIILLSNNICFGPFPSAHEEVQQRLTIHSDGRVWLSRYRYGTGYPGYERIKTERIKIAPQKADSILNVIDKGIMMGEEPHPVCDVGCWDVSVTYHDGKIERRKGPLIEGQDGEEDYLSDMIRDTLAQQNLFAFDGQARFDMVNRLELAYRRVTIIEAKVPGGREQKNYTWDYAECLILDRAKQRIEYVQIIGSGCKVIRQYDVDEGVSTLLDELDNNFFDSITGSPPDAVDDPKESRKFQLTVDFQKAGPRVITGTYNKDGLPSGWAEFIANVYDFMTFYSFGDTLNPEIYTANTRRLGDSMFLSVVFERYGKEYCYLSEDETIRKGDRVEVPTAKAGSRAIVTVVDVQWMPRSQAPIPLEKIKTIIGKVSEEDADEGESEANAEDAADSLSEPLKGVKTQDVLNQVAANNSEEKLATAVADTGNRISWLKRLLSHSKGRRRAIELQDELRAWQSLEAELVSMASLILLAEEIEGGSHISNPRLLPYERIRPFMERNGYRSPAGWWVRRYEPPMDTNEH